MSWRTSFYRGGPVFMSALAGIDIALWDLKGMGLLYGTLSLVQLDGADNMSQRESLVCPFTSSWEAN